MSTKPRALIALAAIDRLVSDRHGGVAIEFAFVIPIAILLSCTWSLRRCDLMQ
jgi:Flp pilus assembly protein TadG